jgi:hypothetical protein
MRVAVRCDLVGMALTALAVCHPAEAPAQSSMARSAAPSSVGAAGTYEMAVCRTLPCAPRDSAAAYVLATVVLLDSAGAIAADMPPSRWEPGRIATGCMVIHHRRSVPESFAGITVREYFIWRDSAGMVNFPLFRSPDAAYDVSARATASGFTGSGRSWGAFEVEIRGPRDTVVAIRTGPPRRLRCHAPDPREKR